jgi:hypothetical protein
MQRVSHKFSHFVMAIGNKSLSGNRSYELPDDVLRYIASMMYNPWKGFISYESTGPLIFPVMLHYESNRCEMCNSFGITGLMAVISGPLRVFVERTISDDPKINSLVYNGEFIWRSRYIIWNMKECSDPKIKILCRVCAGDINVLRQMRDNHNTLFTITKVGARLHISLQNGPCYRSNCPRPRYIHSLSYFLP